MSRSFEQLVNQQIARWQREQDAAAAARAASAAQGAQLPTICFSREFGALGGEVGRIVAARLGFRYYAQELVDEIARHANVTRRVVESLDERTQSWIDEWVAKMMEGGAFAGSDYLRNLSAVVLTLGRHGRGVIIGRGAHLILDPARTLRVRCYCDLEQRVRYISERDGMTPSEARAKIRRVDSERVAFYRQHFRVDVADPIHFDLLLNTGVLSLADCAEIVERAFTARFGSIEPLRVSEPPQSGVVSARPSLMPTLLASADRR